MIRRRLVAGFVLAGLALAQQPPPRIEISLPPCVRSETVEIRYFMNGPFGGYGGFVRPIQDTHAYRIEAAVKDQPAERIRIILYAPGCAIATFDESFSASPNLRRDFLCRELPTVPLAGRIAPLPPGGKKLEVKIEYLAFWDHPFFGIMDGMVSSFPVATSIPAADGSFRADLPDFARDPIASRPDRDGAFHLMVREVKTGNHIGTLEPALPGKTEPWLRIRPAYPPDLVFTLRPR